MKLTIKTLQGLEEVLAAELKALGAKEIEPGIRMVSCTGDQTLLYRANLELRTALRVLVVIDNFMSYDENSLYRMLRKTDWSKYMPADGTLWVDTVNQSRRFRNSQFLSRLTKDAIVDQFREQTGERPGVEKESPNLRINLHIGKMGHTTLSIDSSGEGLHRRGYRRKTGQAPLNEVLAAGLLALAGYQGEQPFIDPMCGSGTIIIEATMLAAKIPPGIYRDFGFQQWPDFDPALWGEIRQTAYDQRRTPPHPIIGADQDLLTLQMAKVALERMKIDGFVSLKEGEIQQLSPPTALADVQPGGILLTNPPYELRIKTGDIEKLYQEIGDAFKQFYAGYSAWLFSANRDALKRVGLRTSRKIPLMNGPLEARLQRYDMYK